GRLHRAEPLPRHVDPLSAPGPEGTQVLDPSRRVVRSTASAGRRPLIDAATLRRTLVARRLGPARQGDRRVIVAAGRFPRRTLGRTLNEMLERLQRALEHERRFVAEASHELRTPLAVLRAELELARSRPRPRAELEAALDSVAEEADRLTRLTDDLLLLARADEGALRDREEVLLADVLETVAAPFDARAHAL